MGEGQNTSGMYVGDLKNNVLAEGGSRSREGVEARQTRDVPQRGEVILHARPALRVQGLGRSVEGRGSRIYGSGSKVWGFG